VLPLECIGYIELVNTYRKHYKHFRFCGRHFVYTWIRLRNITMQWGIGLCINTLDIMLIVPSVQKLCRRKVRDILFPAQAALIGTERAVNFIGRTMVETNACSIWIWKPIALSEGKYISNVHHWRHMNRRWNTAGTYIRWWSQILQVVQLRRRLIWYLTCCLSTRLKSNTWQHKSSLAVCYRQCLTNLDLFNWFIYLTNIILDGVTKNVFQLYWPRYQYRLQTYLLLLLVFQISVLDKPNKILNGSQPFGNKELKTSNRQLTTGMSPNFQFRQTLFWSSMLYLGIPISRCIACIWMTKF